MLSPRTIKRSLISRLPPQYAADVSDLLSNRPGQRGYLQPLRPPANPGSPALNRCHSINVSGSEKRFAGAALRNAPFTPEDSRAQEPPPLPASGRASPSGARSTGPGGARGSPGGGGAATGAAPSLLRPLRGCAGNFPPRWIGIHTRIHISIYTYVHISRCLCVYRRMCVCIRAVCVYICVYIHTEYVCIYLCTHTYTSVHTDVRPPAPPRHARPCQPPRSPAHSPPRAPGTGRAVRAGEGRGGDPRRAADSPRRRRSR